MEVMDYWNLTPDC